MMKRTAIWVAAAVGAVMLWAPVASAQARAPRPYIGAQVTFAERYQPPPRRPRNVVKRSRAYLRGVRDARRDWVREQRRAAAEYRRDVKQAARRLARQLRDARRDWRW